MSSSISITNARLSDARDIARLINEYSDQGMMLPRKPEVIIEEIRNFFVARDGGAVVGCCAVAFFTEEVAEIRSLVVLEKYQNQGIGKSLVHKAEQVLSDEGIRYSFALTYKPEFFYMLGYQSVEKSKFPQKIWRDCVNCTKLMQCDETAVEKDLKSV